MTPTKSASLLAVSVVGSFAMACGPDARNDCALLEPETTYEYRGSSFTDGWSPKDQSPTLRLEGDLPIRLIVDARERSEDGDSWIVLDYELDLGWEEIAVATFDDLDVRFYDSNEPLPDFPAPGEGPCDVARGVFSCEGASSFAVQEPLAGIAHWFIAVDTDDDNVELIFAPYTSP